MQAFGKLTRQPKGFGVLLIVAATLPAVLILGAILSDVFLGSRYLGSNPIKEGEHLFGNWTLRLLVATLSITPLRRITGWNWLAKHRRILGLFAFAYVSLHLLTYALLDVQLDWAEMTKDVLKRPYITIGMLGFLLMIPLAITSTKAMIARLGKRWRKLHRLVYVIAILGVVHFWMSVKRDITEPLVFALIFALLLGWRWRESRRAVTTAAEPAAG